MSPIADSNAVLILDRLLSQHQAALTLLQARLANPSVSRLAWLDLACGKGQILTQLDQNLTAQQRAKVDYTGFDLSFEFGKITDKQASLLGLNSAKVKYGELERFSQNLDAGHLFDFITLTNTIHEIAPETLAAILFDAIDRLKPKGLLFIYDMEELPDHELGAVPWKSNEMAAIVQALLGALGVKTYVPATGSWKHSTVRGWNVTIEREHVQNEVPEISKHREPAINAASEKVREILKQRQKNCIATLEALTRHGTSTENENKEKIAALYEFWALQRALG